VITGFNTDIDYEGVTYHVQTEDKGLATPLILSLVYDRGTILASKRSPYDDLVADGFDEQILVERLQKQHKLICAAISAGRIEDLKRMTMKESALRQKNSIAQKEDKSVVEKNEKNAADSPELKVEEIPMPSILAGKTQLTENFEKEDSALAEAVLDIPLQIIEEPAAEVKAETLILPSEAVEIITDFSNTGQIPDNELKAGELKVELLNETAFKGGEHKIITIMTWRGKREKGLSGAHILVKVLGSLFRPLIYHAKTDSNGVATVHLQLPHFKAGRAAVLVKAMSEGEETELWRVIQPG
jgi:hypothetical protein